MKPTPGPEHNDTRLVEQVYQDPGQEYTTVAYHSLEMWKRKKQMKRTAAIFKRQRKPSLK